MSLLQAMDTFSAPPPIELIRIGHLPFSPTNDFARACSLRGIPELAQNRVAIFVAEPARRGHVDRKSEDGLQVLPDGYEIKQVALRLQLDEDFDVGIRTRLAACAGSEHADADHAEASECRKLGADRVQESIDA
jgi:hypothetical protein